MEVQEDVIRDADQKSNESFDHEQDCCEDASKEDNLDSCKVEMNEVIEENRRLKMLLEQVQKDYKSLQARFNDVFQQKSTNIVNKSLPKTDEDHHTEPEPDFVSLRLGMNSDGVRKDSLNFTCSNKRRVDGEFRDELKLGLDCNFAGLDTSPRDMSDKITKKIGEDDAASVKRARVSVRARCDAPTMQDGCQWRKYGQKTAKGNPCPRAYYRCTVAPSCPVRKQVQRCADDMSILITTYEGTHNHSLPISAAAMASTTSSAASMLLSGSSSAAQPSHGLNPSFLNNSSTRPLYLSPNATNPSFPTITLDLTRTNSLNPSRTLDFSSQSNMTPPIWGNGYPNYGTHMQNLYQDSCQPPLTETLTRAMTTDPNFRSVIMAAISSVVGGSSGNQGGEVGGKMTI